MTTKTITGTDGIDSILIADSSPTPGFNVTLNAVSSGPFLDDTLNISVRFGADTIDLTTLTPASGVLNATISGGEGADTIRDSASDDALFGDEGNDTFTVVVGGGGGDGLDTVMETTSATSLLSFKYQPRSIPTVWLKRKSICAKKTITRCI